MLVELTQAQWTLVQRVVSEGDAGADPGEVLRQALREHAAHIATGGSPYGVGGRRVIELPRPHYGEARSKARIAPATGKAIPVHRGEVLRITQVEGGQCVDFNAYNLDDYKEFLDCGMNRMRGVDTGVGTIVWTGAARARPMYAILAMPDTCDQYYGGHRCNSLMYEMEWELVGHANCQDNFAEAIREYGLTPDDVHDSYNFWMTTSLDDQGRRIFPWNRGQAGDSCDLLAFFDTLAVPVACAGDLASVNSFRPSAVDTTVYSASSATVALVDRVNAELGRFASQRTPADFAVAGVRATRKLERDPSYEPRFPSLGPDVTVEVQLGDEEEEACHALLQHGIYGATTERCVVASFCRWYESNRVSTRHVSLRFEP